MYNIIQLLSGPRNISTALMYSFESRGDTQVVDEPFYACYLSLNKIEYHPATEEILKEQSSNPQEVVDQLLQGNFDKPNLFIKNMAHHLEGFDYSYSYDVSNVFLIRDPRQLINSFAKVIKAPVASDLGLERELELFQEICAKGKKVPVVIDSGQLLKDPPKVLKKLCRRLDIPFTEKMLSWRKGPRKEDGVWARHWYRNVHGSTGFEKQKGSEDPLNENFRWLYDEVMPYYRELFENAIKA